MRSEGSDRVACYEERVADLVVLNKGVYSIAGGVKSESEGGQNQNRHHHVTSFCWHA